MTEKAEPSEIVKKFHAEWTKPGSFYERNGGRFKGQNVMTREEEFEYVRRVVSAS